MKCLEVIYIRVKVKGHLRNISSSEVSNFDEKGIKNKNKITYNNDNIKNTIKFNNKEVILIREGIDFINTFIFNEEKSYSNYLLKDNNYSFDIDVTTLKVSVKDNSVMIKYKIDETDMQYEFYIEVSEIL